MSLIKLIRQRCAISARWNWHVFFGAYWRRQTVIRSEWRDRAALKEVVVPVSYALYVAPVPFVEVKLSVRVGA